MSVGFAKRGFGSVGKEGGDGGGSGGAAASAAASSAASGGGAGEERRPRFAPLGKGKKGHGAEELLEKAEIRRVPVPPHRLSPLRDQWPNVRGPLVEHMGLLVRMNTKTQCVELMASDDVEDAEALQRGEEFVRAFMCGFDVDDALALLRVSDIAVESFDVTEVKSLHGDHLSRAIGRIAGTRGRTKHAIEHATRTRIVVAHTRVHILGATANVAIARDAIGSLILGAPPSKVYNHMRTVAARLSSRY